MLRAVTVLSIAILAWAGPQSAHAQDRPVVFVHGFGSSAETWQGAASRLQSALAIRSETPSLKSTALIEAQADELQQKLGGLGADVVAIGHSNGGLVARQWNRRHPASGIVTVGTPHRGTPLVHNLPAYAGFNAGLIVSINEMYRAFGEGCCSWQWILSAYSGLWSLAADVAASSMPRIVGAVAVNTALPVSPEMTPGSAFLSALNSSSNLEREMSAVPLRAGIVSTARNFYWGGAFRAAFPDQGDLLAYWRDAARIGMEAYAAYIFAQAPSEDWWAFEIASQMMTAAYYLWVMDEWWCQSVSVVGGGVCWVNDTLVPQWSQTYPGGVYIDTGWEGPAHTQETRMSDALLDRVLTNYMSIPRRPSPPPSSASTVFYDDVGFGGGSFRGEGALAFVGWEWNDRVSSIHVPSGRTVVLYEHADFDGETLTITGDDADLRQHVGPGPDGTWNDVVSSVRVY